MRKTSKVQGTKIAQAAKDLNVTSVTIRRYVSEFGIETTTDENGIKVLPDVAMDELKEVRRLKEEGYTNPMVLEFLEEKRSQRGSGGQESEEAKPEKTKSKAKSKGRSKEREAAPAEDSDDDEAEEAEAEEEVPQITVAAKKRQNKRVQVQEDEREDEGAEDEEAADENGDAASADAPSSDGRLKHSLTCQTCGKTFEHMNPRLRDCLDCYRAKRKERRRGGDRHKNVIQHPLAQQVASKMANQQQQQQQQQEQERQEQHRPIEKPKAPQRREAPQPSHSVGVTQPVIGGLKTQVRSYRKAIEETRQITGSLKRRLERPDLPEGDRRWLEQIYAYQLILHQGWRHLSEYRATTQAQKDD